ncbi:MAG: F0F1 ATP synthase subunit A [Cytophagales bacterium]|nr:F0F1 ATP synthase subunit A [Cytophagales bacterium]
MATQATKPRLFRRLALVLILLMSSVQATYASGGGEGGKEEFNPGKLAIEHVMDAYEWHLYDSENFGGVIYLPIIVYSKERGVDVFMSSKFFEHHHPVNYNGLKLGEHGIEALNPNEKIYDFSITKTVASSIVSCVLLIALFLSVAKGYAKNRGRAPSGIQSFLEPLILFVRDDIAKTIIGEKYEKFTPYLLSVFFFILINNLMGLMPGAANVTGNITVTLVLAAFTFIVTNANGNKHYWGHIFWMPGIPKPMRLIMAPIEFIGLFTKPFALTVRLFANITAGHIVILSIISLIFLFKSYIVSVPSIALAAAMNFLELMVAFIQAYVFTLLSAIYISGAVEEHH